jgi:gluconate 2-dehydrogenase gamma chain
LIPTDANGPGAAEARAAHYIDRALTGPLQGSRDNYRVGLAALDDYSVATKGVRFIQLTDADKDSLLTDVEANRAPGFLPSASAFFAMVRGHTIQGTFCDPYYGGNADFVGWDLIGYPGVRTAVSPDEQRRLTTDLIPVRRSAYDIPTFSKRRLGDVSTERGHDD